MTKIEYILTLFLKDKFGFTIEFENVDYLHIGTYTKLNMLLKAISFFKYYYD